MNSATKILSKKSKASKCLRKLWWNVFQTQGLVKFTSPTFSVLSTYSYPDGLRSGGPVENDQIQRSRPRSSLSNLGPDIHWCPPCPVNGKLAEKYKMYQIVTIHDTTTIGIRVFKVSIIIPAMGGPVLRLGSHVIMIMTSAIQVNIYWSVYPVSDTDQPHWQQDWMKGRPLTCF